MWRWLVAAGITIKCLETFAVSIGMEPAPSAAPEVVVQCEPDPAAAPVFADANVTAGRHLPDLGIGLTAQ